MLGFGYGWDEMPETLTRSDVKRILEKHGTDTTSPRAYWPLPSGEFEADPTSTFDLEVGIKDTYTTESIAIWLNY